MPVKDYLQQRRLSCTPDFRRLPVFVRIPVTINKRMRFLNNSEEN